MKLTTFNPIQSLDYLFNVDSCFGNEFPFTSSMIETQEPRVNIRDDGNKLIIEASVAGYAKDEINLEIEDDTLTLSGNKNEDKETEQDGYQNREFFHTNFKRHFNLGEEVDRENISAEVKNGILMVHLPKMEKTQSIKIPIAVN